MIENKKKICFTAILALCVLTILSVIIISVATALNDSDTAGYDHEWIIGRTKAEIEDEYGKFDSYADYPFISDTLTNTGYYIIKECYSDWFGEKPGTRYCVHFNEHEIAVYCELEYYGDYGEWWSMDPIATYEK